MELFFDTETSDMYKFKKPYSDFTQPWIVQLGFILSERDSIFQEGNLLISAGERKISSGAEAVHCISVESTNKGGLKQDEVLKLFESLILRADILVCHNTAFDMKVVLSNAYKIYSDEALLRLTTSSYQYCTMLNGTHVCKLPGRYGKYKWPKLQELHKFLFGEEFKDAHDALADVRACRRCYYEMNK